MSMCSKTGFTTEIRRSVAEDKETVIAIIKQTKFFRPEEIVIAEEVLDDAVSAGPDGDYQSYVAVNAEKVIGWICFGATPCTDGTFDIYWVAVDPEYQGRGVGKSLMRYATAIIKKHKGRLITVDTSGSPRYISTCQFYESLGYCKEACLKDFYFLGDDKVIYIKRI